MDDDNSFPIELDSLLLALARMFAGAGAPKEVAILANAKAEINLINYDNWNGGTYTYTLSLQVPTHIYSQLIDDREEVEKRIGKHIDSFLRPYPNDHLDGVLITPLLTSDPEWRDKAQTWLAGTGVNNQGRVRSDNIASRTCDGLLFRSEAEILLYKALKARAVSFAPLPVFVRGGDNYRRIEPDFVILKDGIVLIVEVDGDTVHHETPAEAHDRTTMLAHEGANIERVKASECATQELANACADKLLRVIDKLKTAR